MFSELKITALPDNYDEIMDTIVGSLVICGFKIHIREAGQDDDGKYQVAYIGIEFKMPGDKCGECNNVKVVRI